MKIPTRQYFLTTRGWRPVVLAILLTALMLGCVLVAQRAEAQQRPKDAAEFVAMFKAHKLGHMPTGRHRAHYSKSFKRYYKHAFVRAEKAHYRKGNGKSSCQPWQSCWITGDEAWDEFQFNSLVHCAAKVGLGTEECRLIQERAFWRSMIRGQWPQGVHMEGPDKWTVRIGWCAGIGIASFYTGGSAAAAIGPGAMGCLGGFLVH